MKISQILNMLSMVLLIGKNHLTILMLKLNKNKKLKKKIKNLDFILNNSFFLLKTNKKMNEISTINKSGRNGPEISAIGIKINNADAKDK